MNERIKELEKQCWDNQTNHLNAEKFAALVAAAERERFVAYPSGVVTGPCVCGSWPGGECLRCDVTDKAAAIIRAENERLREKLAKAWKTVG